MIPAGPVLLALTASHAAASRRNFGDKAWTLRRMQRQGVRVPRAWVVPTAIYDVAVAPLRARIAEHLRALSAADPQALAHAAAQVQEWLQGLSLGSELSRALHELMPEAPAERFAVRSSVTGEDGAGASAAGVYASVLDVPRAGLADAVLSVWASTFGAAALAYRQRKGLELEAASAAVLIQPMVGMVAGGVLFTREPDGGAHCCVIGASAGAAHDVTSGARPTETWRIDWLAPRPAARPVGNAALHEASVRRLRDLGVRLDNAEGGPLDIEWALDRDGEIWLLQARPLAVRTRPSRRRIWDNANIVESFPGLTLPLTFSFARILYAATFRGVARALFPLSRRRIARFEAFDHLLGLIQGRVYLNLINWYLMLSHLPGFATHVRAWNQMFGITREIVVEPQRLNVLERTVCVVKQLYLLLATRRLGLRFVARFEQLYSEFGTLDSERCDEAELLERYGALISAAGRFWSLTIENDFCLMTWYRLLRMACRSWLPHRPGLHDRLLSGQTDLASISPCRSADALLCRPTAAPGHTVDAAEGEPEHLAALSAHLIAYGDRGIEDLKLERPSFRERPELFAAAMAPFLGQGERIADLEERARARRKEAERDLGRELRHPLKRAIIFALVHFARSAIANRERMRLDRTRLYGVARSLFVCLGTRLAEHGALAAVADIHYLTVSELIDFCRGAAVDCNLRRLVARRKAQYRLWRLREPPARAESEGSPYLALTRSVDAAPSEEGRARGCGCSPGTACGPARIVLDAQATSVGEGEIIVARSTDPGWIFLMTRCAGLVVERGSELSHTAIMARELGIPIVVGVKDATKRIPCGARLSIDGTTGEVTWA